MTLKTSKKASKFDKTKELIIQSRKGSAIHSLLFIARKLGEVEGLISIQNVPDEELNNVRKDFLVTYNILIETAGIKEIPEVKRTGIGGEVL